MPNLAHTLPAFTIRPPLLPIHPAGPARPKAECSPRPNSSLYLCSGINRSTTAATNMLMSRLGISRPEAAGIGLLLDEHCAKQPDARSGWLGECGPVALASILHMHRLDPEALMAACLAAGMVELDDHGHLINVGFTDRYRLTRAKEQGDAARQAALDQARKDKARLKKQAQRQGLKVCPAPMPPAPPAQPSAGWDRPGQAGTGGDKVGTRWGQIGDTLGTASSPMPQNTTCGAQFGTIAFGSLSYLFSLGSSLSGERSNAAHLAVWSAAERVGPLGGPPLSATAADMAQVGSRRGSDLSAEIVRVREEPRPKPPPPLPRPPAANSQRPPERRTLPAMPTEPPSFDDDFMQSLVEQGPLGPPASSQPSRPGFRAKAPWQRPLHKQTLADQSAYQAKVQARPAPAAPPSAPRPQLAPTPPKPPMAAAAPAPAPRPSPGPAPAVPAPMPPGPKLSISAAQLGEYICNGILLRVWGDAYMASNFAKDTPKPTPADAHAWWRALGPDKQLAKVHQDLGFLLKRNAIGQDVRSLPAPTLDQARAYLPLVEQSVQAITQANFDEQSPDAS